MAKVLLFEGAGMSYEANELSDVCNHRIRTAFINNDGIPVYFECSGHSSTTKYVNGKKKKVAPYWTSHVDFAFYLVGDDPCNESRINHDHMTIGYTKADIVKLVNDVCSTSFEDMEVLNDMEGYRVHGDKREYNLMENHVINRERTAARIKTYAEIDAEYRKQFSSKYSCTHIVSMDADSITIRCYSSKEALQRAGMTEDERIRIIPIKY